MSGRVLAAMVALVLSACSNAPSEGLAKQAFRDKVQVEARNVPVEVTSFRKTNGQAFEVMGIKGYRFLYEATVSFPEGNRPECVPQGGSFRGFDCAFAFGIGRGSLRPQTVGASVTYTGEIAFQKTEQGWTYGAVTMREQ